MSSPSLVRLDRVLERILDAVELEGVELEDAAESALGGQPEAVRLQVEALLPRLLEPAELLDRGFQHAAPQLGERLAEASWQLGPKNRAGDRLGPYRLLRELGRGGMGVVYLAERADRQYDQRVAIKLVSSTPGTVALSRFLRERQFLADLQHPAIARLLDGGVTDAGDPYLVMELVEGRPIDRHCNRLDAPVEERLAVFLDVCDAVHYAHRRLIVHRDLKAANILVTDEGAVKLLDFGIARLLDTEDNGESATRTVLRAFTPEYASPEQIRGERVGIPSDVYSLGVLLYRLLTERAPYRTTGVDPAEVSRVVSEVEPQVPSRRISEEADGPRAQKLARRLRGDLDNIVLKALAKRPEERYADVAELAADLRRHLEGRPVVARSATRTYRLGKLLRRHRLGVAAAAAIVASLILGLALTARQARQTAEERDRAQREAAKAATVAAFLTELFDSADPYLSGATEPSVRDLLERGERRIATDLADHLEARADLLGAIGGAYRSLGDYARAQPLTEEALALQRALRPPDPSGLVRALLDHAGVRESHGDSEGARRLYAEAVDRLEASGSEPSVELADGLAGLAGLPDTPRDDKEGLYRRAIETRERAEPGADAEKARLLQDLAVVYEERGEFARATRLKREALRMTEESLGPDHPMVHLVTSNLALAVWIQGDFAEAEGLYRAAAAGLEQSLGRDHPDLANTYSSFGKLLLELGRRDEAAWFVESAARLGGAVPGESYATSAHQVNVATLRREQGRTAEALALYESALAYFRERLGEEHAAVARLESLIAQCLRIDGEPARAERLFRRALTIQEQGHPHDRALAETRRGLGGLLCARGAFREGAPVVERGCEGIVATGVADPLRAAECLLDRASCRIAAGREALGLRLLDEAEALLAESLPDDHYLWDRARRIEGLASAGVAP
ncbi:MAG TPA: serine/threonine-protein kinase [Thermoanaerobaculia bacterium]|nr:serine/threonine-protein kinase [Thermoanaerobaculia bacterium]